MSILKNLHTYATVSLMSWIQTLSECILLQHILIFYSFRLNLFLREMSFISSVLQGIKLYLLPILLMLLQCNLCIINYIHLKHTLEWVLTPLLSRYRTFSSPPKISCYSSLAYSCPSSRPVKTTALFFPVTKKSNVLFEFALKWPFKSSRPHVFAFDEQW